MKPSFIAFVWLGIAVGVSFMATPIKFTAPSLDLPTALEVGRVTFRLLARVEWTLAAVLVGWLLWTRRRPPWSVWLAVALVVLESVWLLPALGVRTDAIRAGRSVPPSSLHGWFVAAEALKCLALAHGSVTLSRRERCSS